MDDTDRKEILRRIFSAGLAAVDPETAIRHHVLRRGANLEVDGHCYHLPDYRQVWIVGGGKASAPMAKALSQLIGDHLSGGTIVVKYDHGMELDRVRVLEAAHPVPDQAGVRGTETILELLSHCAERDLVMGAFSGGGSALLPAPRPPLSLEDKQRTTRLLLECGADIHEINCIRKHLSRSKGGGMARATYPARLVSLFLSDVIGDDLDVIASGPTVADRSSFQDCLQIIAKYRLRDALPQPVFELIERGVAGREPETPKPGAPLFEKVQNVIVGNNRAALEAAAEKARSLGYRPVILTSCLEGEASEVAKAIAAVAKEVAWSGRPVQPPACILAGGETTVTVKGSGKGGRNQEFALSLALAIAGQAGVWALCAGTDGTDGPTDAAGALVSGSTIAAARRAGLDALEHLRDNNAYPFFLALGDLLITGPTRTNVMDMVCVLVE